MYINYIYGRRKKKLKSIRELLFFLMSLLKVTYSFVNAQLLENM